MKRFYILALLVGLAAFSASAQSNLMTVNFDKPTQKIFEEANKDSWFKRDVLFSTLVGAAVALAGTLLAHWLQVRKENQNDAQFIQNVLKSIRVEIEALKRTYDLGIGKKLRATPDGEILTWRLAFTQSHFTVYESNATHLGKIPPEMSERIVNIYALMKVTVEEFLINNNYLNRRDAIIDQSHRSDLKTGASLDIGNEKRDLENLMKAQAKQLKELDLLLATYSGQVFHEFSQIGIHGSQGRESAL